MKEFIEPTINDVNKIAQNFGGNYKYTISRFETGLCHYVFNVSSSEKKFVVRICHPSNLKYFLGHLFWQKEIQKFQLPTAKTLHVSIGKENYDYLILEKIEGIDLGQIYQNLGQNEKIDIVRNLVNFQKVAENLEYGKGFGWGLNYSCKQLQSTWIEVIDSTINKAKEWIDSVGKVEAKYINQLNEVKLQFIDYFEKIQPMAFFHDLTTKNLLISTDSHKVVGIIDIDEMGFGDKYFHLSLMNMALLANEYNNDLVYYWMDELRANKNQIRAMSFYTLIHCVVFMGENGMSFNKNSTFNEQYQVKMDRIFNLALNNI